MLFRSGYIGLIEWLLGAPKGVMWVNFLTRDVLENAMSFTEALYRLSTTKIIAPAYFILGGNSSTEVWRTINTLRMIWLFTMIFVLQGSIITRSREKAEDVWLMGTRNSSWYLLQTNYDNWKAPFFLDDRRTPGNMCMRKMTQKVRVVAQLCKTSFNKSFFTERWLFWDF